MEQSKQGSDLFDAVVLIKRLWRWGLVIGIVGAVAFGATFLATRLVQPRYESHAILYPTLSSNREKQIEEFAYGFEVHSERLMQLLSSDVILDSLNARYDLIGHYGINMQRRTWYDDFVREARSRILIRKTRYTSVIVSVIDEDPELAAHIANDVAELVNEVNAAIVKSNAREVLRAVEDEYQNRLQKVRAVNDSIDLVQEGTSGLAQQRLQAQITEKRASINRIRTELGLIRSEFNVFDIAHQVNVLNEELASARANFLQESGRLDVYLENKTRVKDSLILAASAARKGAERRVNHFEEQLKALSKAGARYNSLSALLEEEELLLRETLTRLEAIRNSVEPQFETRRIESLEADYNWDQLQTLELKRKYQHALSNYLDPAPAAYIVSRARPSYIKVYPRTTLSLILVTLGSMMMAAVAVLFWERIREGGGK